MKDHISVCVATFHRNQSLERLLRKLAAQETAGLFDYSVVVVDNDADGSAAETVGRVCDASGLRVTYDVEAERTIPAVRNHALGLACGNYIAIIDDDEFPPPFWLLNLYKGIQTFDVDGGLGPVHPFFTQEPPSWLIKGGFCERPVSRTGALLRWDQTRTGNVLLKRDVFDRHHLGFDPKFRTGGSDREFFKQAMRLGYRFVAVAEAPVYEEVPPERWQRGYWVKRAVVNGFNAHQNSRDQMGTWRAAFMTIRLLGAVLVYASAMPFCACFGTHAIIRCLERGAHHLSRLCAMAGIELVKRRDF